MQITGNVQGLLDLIGGSEVSVVQVLESGTKIAIISIDNEDIDIYAPTPETPPAPTEVVVTPILQSGEKIASISVDGESSDIYAPKGGEIILDNTERLIGKWMGEDLYEKVFTGPLPHNSYTTNIANLTTEGIKEIVSANGYLKNTNTGRRFILGGFCSSQASAGIDINNNNVGLYYTYTISNQGGTYAIAMRYTKVTT